MLSQHHLLSQPWPTFLIGFHPSTSGWFWQEKSVPAFTCQVNLKHCVHSFLRMLIMHLHLCEKILKIKLIWIEMKKCLNRQNVFSKVSMWNHLSSFLTCLQMFYRNSYPQSKTVIAFVFSLNFYCYVLIVAGKELNFFIVGHMVWCFVSEMKTGLL